MTEFSLETGVVATFYRPSSTAVTVLPQGTPISGTDGDDGADGKTIHNGSGAPSDLLGANGDYYIDNGSPKTIYGPKAGGVWPLPGTSMIGPAGSSAIAGGHPYLLMGG
jgi:hypothetical protein